MTFHLLVVENNGLQTVWQNNPSTERKGLLYSSKLNKLKKISAAGQKPTYPQHLHLLCDWSSGLILPRGNYRGGDLSIRGEVLWNKFSRSCWNMKHSSLAWSTSQREGRAPGQTQHNVAAVGDKGPWSLSGCEKEDQRRDRWYPNPSHLGVKVWVEGCSSSRTLRWECVWLHRLRISFCPTCFSLPRELITHRNVQSTWVEI